MGGVMGFLKAKSKISLISSSAFALLLVPCALQIFPEMAANGILGSLVLVFGIRLAKTKKWMPSGMMLIVTALILVLRFLKIGMTSAS
jgi:uncharacterized membrane protein (UPF0136 family)